MLIDKYLPKYDFREYHQDIIQSQSPAIYQLMLQADVGNSSIIKLLFRLRGMPAGGQINELEKLGFTRLEESIGEELVFGMISTTWFFGQSRYITSPEEFIADEDPQHIKAVINFRVQHHENEKSSIISTETRVQCGSRSIRKKFRVYWFVVQPFSKLIRRLMLKEIKKNILKQIVSIA